MNQQRPPRRLYLVTPQLGDPASFVRDVGAALDAGDIAAILLRLEKSDERTLINRAKAVLCIGEIGGQIAELLEDSTIPNPAPAYRCGDLATAIKMARQIAVDGDVVLLSPGFASYDQFVNFEKRGEEFARLVWQ